MLDDLGQTQQKLLKSLLTASEGLTADDLAKHLGISRPAVRQHLTGLEASGYLEKGKAVSTGGRPGQRYVLTEKGHNLFPKQYSLFSELLLQAIIAEKGEKGARKWLDALGRQVAGSFAGKITGGALKDRIAQSVAVMNELAYEAYTTGGAKASDPPAIEARNCVYHNLAGRHREVCQFDLALLSDLTGAQAVQEKCIQDGDTVCRFCFKKKFFP